jgi:hypothetical protein
LRESANRKTLELLNRELPRDAVLITTSQLVHLEPYVTRGTDRQLVPLSRRLEYAGKITAWKKVENPAPYPVFYGDHMCAGILAGGGEWGVAKTAQEDLESLRLQARAGRPLYLDLSHADPLHDRSIVERIGRMFAAVEVAPDLYRLTIEAPGN